MIQHRAARFVLNKSWRRNHRDSITEMLRTLNWLSLKEHRKQSRLVLLFKFLNRMIHIPKQYLPAPSPLTITRANHNQKLMQLCTRTNQYLHSFLPRTISDRNNLDIEDLAYCDLDSFKDYLFSSCSLSLVIFVH